MMSALSVDQLNQRYDSLSWPTFLSCEARENTVVIGLNIHSELEYFRGHFPEQSVVPGVVQIHWASELAKLLFMVDGFQALKGSKFSGMLLPGEEVVLTLKYKMEKQLVLFNYAVEDRKISNGQIQFAQEGV